MKMMKNLLAAAAVLAIGCVSAFAFDVESVNCIPGKSFSRETFEDAHEDIDADIELITEILEEDYEVATLYHIEADDYDEDDDEVFDLVIDEIRDNYKKNCQYVTLVIGEYDEDADLTPGWYVMSHAASKSDIVCYSYYFEIVGEW